MYQVIIVVHVLLGLGVVGLVLMQQGKGADAGAAFGSGSSGSVFGAQGAASFLSRTTAIFAALFFATSLGLAVLGAHHDEQIDLMDAPEVENVKEDVPLVDNGTDTSLSALQGDIPQTGLNDASTVGDAVSEKVQTVTTEDVQAVSDELEKGNSR